MGRGSGGNGFNLDMPLLKISPRDYFTLRDACAGVHIFGGIGSGKTSGSGKALAGAYLRAGMGGLVLCAKPEEVQLWLNYAKAHGRSNSVILFNEKSGFNFITYELARHGMRGTANVTECLLRILESADHVTTGDMKSSDPFWTQATRQVLNYAIPLLYAAYGTVTVEGIIEFVMSAATTRAQLDSDEWNARSYAAQTLQRATDHPVVSMDGAMLRSALDYWCIHYLAIPEKTRGNIQITISAKLDRFRHGNLRHCFCGQTTVVPEMTFHGAIIILAMPALTWNDDGIIGQQLFKFMWQRAVESRNGLEHHHQARPVFLWADEAQYFVNVKDDEFLSTCRGSRACVVFLTQTLPTYYARLGKDKSDAADGLVGKFSTQIFHQNACNRTNIFASQLIGRGIHQRSNASQSVGTSRNMGMNMGYNESHGSSYSSGSSSGPGGSSSNSSGGSNSSAGESWGRNQGRGTSENQSWGTSEQMDNLIEPNVFASQLKSGGPSHRNQVTAVWFKAGGNFVDAGGRNFLFPTFQQ